jgi:hypothetical protein
MRHFPRRASNAVIVPAGYRQPTDVAIIHGAGQSGGCVGCGLVVNAGANCPERRQPRDVNTEPGGHACGVTVGVVGVIPGAVGDAENMFRPPSLRGQFCDDGYTSNRHPQRPHRRS